jgi:hypothetical protein
VRAGKYGRDGTIWTGGARGTLGKAWEGAVQSVGMWSDVQVKVQESADVKKVWQHMY